MAELKLGTSIDCNKEGHCPHEGTAAGSLYCCKCGQYLSYGQPLSYSKLMAQGYQVMGAQNTLEAEELLPISLETWPPY